MLSWTHIIVVVLLVVLLFGTGRVSDLMGDVAKGIKSFKKGLADEDEFPVHKPEPRTIDATVTREAQSEDKDRADRV